MSKQINLEEVLKINSDELNHNQGWYNETDVLTAMRQAVEQAIDLCAENASIDWLNVENEEDISRIDKQSILNTKQLIK
jgi:hypothetical protein